MNDISADFPFNKHKVKLLASEMAYVETGHSAAVTVVFLHGNPTSSYLWRNVIPPVAAKARCVAPDLIGMGDSGKLPGSEYRYTEHARYVEAFLDAVVPAGKIVLVLHDWGSILGFDWARRHEDRVAGLALMEFGRPWRTWEEFPENGREVFQALRSPEMGRKMAIDDNFFIEQFLPERGGPQAEPRSRWIITARLSSIPPHVNPCTVFQTTLPSRGNPRRLSASWRAAHAWLLANDLPKLLFWGQPGVIITEDLANWYTEHLHHSRTVNLGPGLHYLQEDNPHLIGREIVAWLPGLDVGAA